MTRKQIVSVTALLFATIVIYVLCLNFLLKPQFVLDAQERLESYLSYSYGPLDCLSMKDKGGEWEISCNTNDGKYSFIYAVHDAKERPYGFLLTALTDDARDSYSVDLISYLDIKTSSN
jgi:hypothetical protein